MSATGDIVYRLRVLATDHEADDVLPDVMLEAADEIGALRGAVQALAGWIRDLDPHPDLDPGAYLTDASEQAVVRRAFSNGNRTTGGTP